VTLQRQQRRLADVWSNVAFFNVHNAAGSMTRRLMKTMTSRRRHMTGAMALQGQRNKAMPKNGDGWMRTKHT
jgi:hypothetical protein